jgi:methylmalonyl-CoA/ethylmalonyl-CoA epimerase
VIVSLDHIAIAVPDLTEAIERYAQDFGLTLSGTEAVVSQQTTTAFFPVTATQVELIHPINGQGAVAKSLEKRGGGLHHLCFRTDDIIADMKRLSERGYLFLSDAPQPGAHGTQVVFIHPKTTGGVLIELAEYPAKTP